MEADFSRQEARQQLLSALDALGEPDREILDRYGISPLVYAFVGGIERVSRIPRYENDGIRRYLSMRQGDPRFRTVGGVDALYAAGEGSRIELRSPDSSANPYLALALIIKAGLWGIRNKLALPAPGGEGEPLPQTLKEALDEMASDPLAKEVLGDEALASYLNAKTGEWNEYQTRVTSWEIDRYLSQY